MENVQLIIEELQSQWNVFKLHFGVEVVRKGNNYYIDYRSKNNVFLGKWKFVSKYEDRGESVVHNIKVDAKNISVDDNIYTLVEKGIVTFKNFDPKFLDLIKKKLKNQNSPEQRTGWFVAQVRDIHELEIFVEENQKWIMC